MTPMKRARTALYAVLFFVIGVLAISSCTAILGIDTNYGDNPCSTGDLPPQSCGMGACSMFIDALGSCDGGLPVTCMPKAPAPQEICGDGIDNDCNGEVDENTMGDCACMATSGAPLTKACYNGSTETRNKGLCHDGTQPCQQNSSWGQCTGDQLPVAEICDHFDNNCNGMIDEGCKCTPGDPQPCYGGPLGTENVGICRPGVQTCGPDGQWGLCVGGITPQLETCDNLDHNCDGTPGNAPGCACVNGTTVPCYTGPPATKNMGICVPGFSTCVNGKYDLTVCVGEITPQAEQCNGKDNNCDGVIDMGGAACKPTGTPCTQGMDCESQNCVDGVCCDQPCTGLCQACSALKKGLGMDGKCEDVLSGTDPNGECPPQDPLTCKNAGKCDGHGACLQYTNGFPCMPAACDADGVTLHNPTTCLNGQCSGITQTSCAPFLCSSATNTCTSSCTLQAMNCASNGYCNGQMCQLKATQGNPCASDAQCATGHCVDGVCCDKPCTGVCQACSAAVKGGGADGTCDAVAPGTDPRNDCAPAPQATCQQDGLCNGHGACELYPTGYVCQLASCAGSSWTPQSTCDGMGHCPPSTAVNCAPLVCDPGSPGSPTATPPVPPTPAACKQSCSSDSDCSSSSSFCAPGGQCQPRQGLGATCTSTDECSSGFCVDQVCCNGLCGGLCQSCVGSKTGGMNGTCMPIKLGTDPDNECSLNPVTTCQQDGFCNGAGACELYTVGTQCSIATCAAGSTSLNNPSVCNGQGICNPGGTTNCAPYLCANGACTQSCNADSDCNGNDYCSMGACVTKKGTSQPCGASDQCVSGDTCVDGVCCSSPCNGSCMACAQALTGVADGTCAPIPPDQPDTNPLCGGVSDPAHICNGANACVKVNGQSCNASTDCLSTFCVDGVCCNTGCSTACNACSAVLTAGANGTCAPVTNGTTDPRHICVQTSAMNCGTDGKCSAGACEDWPSNTVCVAASCGTGATLNTAQMCNGSGTCSAPATTSCGRYNCKSGACPTTCVVDGDCSTSNYCNVGAGTCQPLGNAGAACGANNQCMSGVCGTTGMGNCCAATCLPIGTACGAIGCDGSGACTFTSMGVSCGTPACVGGMLTTPTCNGQGACNNSTAPCPGHLACVSTMACNTACGGGSAASDTKCAAGFYCDGVGPGACQPKGNAGSACSAGDQCASGVCSTTGMGNCCAMSCSPIGGTCGATGCDTTGACEFPLASTSCAATSCANGQLTTFTTCNGAGACLGTPAQSPCPGSAICASATACYDGCGAAGAAGDAKCASGFYCDGVGPGACQPKGNAGATCSAGDQCTSGVCGTTGMGNCCAMSCSPVGGTCGAMGCDTTGACEFTAMGTSCAATSCMNGQLTTLTTCNGAGVCLSSTAACMGNFACADGTSCRIACGTNDATGDQNCAPSFWCNGTGQGACQAPQAKMAVCNRNRQCTSNSCNTTTGKCN